VLLLTDKHTSQFAFFYLACFLLSYAWYFYNGLLFSQIQPVFFVNRLDFARNILMLSKLQRLLLGNNWLCACFDVIYLILPVMLTVAVAANSKGKKIIAFSTVIFSFIYGIFFSGISYISPELMMGWVLIPLIFSANTLQGFYFYLHSIRIIFILMLVSAGLWKLKAGGLFNIEEMAGILLRQHQVYLVSNKDDWFTQFVFFLVQHKVTAYIFYLLATVAELIFAAGLFTRKLDKFLIIVFCLFFLFDFFLMRINYFSWIVFMGCFYFSQFDIDKKKIIS